eukprot:5038117-Pleurochrysis_carterae.AAC.3
MPGTDVERPLSPLENGHKPRNGKCLTGPLHIDPAQDANEGLQCTAAQWPQRTYESTPPQPKQTESTSSAATASGMGLYCDKRSTSADQVQVATESSGPDRGRSLDDALITLPRWISYMLMHDGF